jgi:RimJ/RimL family protein N-acetyltransferase
VPFTFRRLRAADLTRLEAWLAKSHVARWFGDPDDWLEEIAQNLDTDWITHLRADLDGAPAGFAQWYDTARAPSGLWSAEPAGTLGLDFLLGEPALLGRGLGTQLVSGLATLAVERTRAARLIADPEPGNVSSVRALERAGFRLDAVTGLYVRDTRARRALD